MKWAGAAIAIFGGLLMLATALPLVPSNEWWIRVWDFPRIQIAVLIALVVLATPLALDRAQVRTWAFAAGLIVALACQLVRIWPFTPLHAAEVAVAVSCDPASRVRLLIANVLMRTGPPNRFSIRFAGSTPTSCCSSRPTPGGTRGSRA